MGNPPDRNGWNLLNELQSVKGAKKCHMVSKGLHADAGRARLQFPLEADRSQSSGNEGSAMPARSFHFEFAVALSQGFALVELAFALRQGERDFGLAGLEV